MDNNLLLGEFVSFSTYAALLEYQVNKNLSVFGAVFGQCLGQVVLHQDGVGFTDFGKERERVGRRDVRGFAKQRFTPG